MLKTKKIWAFIALALCGSWQTIKAQTTILGQDTTLRPITTAVPFLAITPDARAGAMGDAGVATSPDANAVYWNPAKLAFTDKKYGFSLAYNPWLRNLVNDMSLSYLTGFYKLDDKQAIGIELRYFNMGEIEYRDQSGALVSINRATEFAAGGTYSRKLSPKMGVAVSGRFIYSNIAANVQIANQQESKAGVTGAADISWYYTDDNMFKVAGRPTKVSFGANISNIGAKISYINAGTQDFIPTNLRLGTAMTTSLDPMDKNKLTLAIDLNKLMVPSPAQVNSQGQVVKGSNPRDKTVLSGMFGSFGDAPDGFSEEIQEFTMSIGAEYSYDNLFFVRAGHFGENKNKGNRKYFTVGAGFRYDKYAIDVAYLIPQGQNNPLAETLRFTLGIAFADKQKDKTFSETEKQ